MEVLGKFKNKVYIKTKYHDGNLAVIVNDAIDSQPYGVLSINFEESSTLLPDHFFVKTYSENESWYKEAIESGLFQETAVYPLRLKHITAPIWKIVKHLEVEILEE